ncbi:MAG: regulatory protein [Gaiellaceae bacterium]|jgi:regulatory protein|nr:regulatory protein [Gaiellaceae bacterium]
MEDGPQRAEALAVATRALARREHSRCSLQERLLRAGVPSGEADEVVEELQRVGLLDDGRFARERARVLAERGKGDAAIRFDLQRAGIEGAAIEQALESLEAERDRARRVVERRGASPETARLLAGRGFDEDVVAALVAQER